MGGLSEEVEYEVEALAATYGEEEVAVQRDGGGATVALAVAPRTAGGAEHERFVAARLLLAVGPGYPSRPAAVQLADAKGLGDARLAALQAALAAEAAALAGELQLGQLVECALDLLTAANAPEGDCAFCLQPLLPAATQGDDGGGDGGLLRLPCFHCFHLACFAPWWQWQQRRLGEREAQLWAEYKSMAPLRLEGEGIRRQALHATAGGGGSGGAEAEAAAPFVLACPACRAEVAPASLAHVAPALRAASESSWAGAGGGRAALRALPPDQQRALRALQAAHAAVSARQRACGGLVDATHSVSLSDLQQAADAARADEAAPPPPAAALQPSPLLGCAAAEAGGRGPGGQQRGGRAPSRHGGRGRGGGHGHEERARDGASGGALPRGAGKPRLPRGPPPAAAGAEAAAAQALNGLRLDGPPTQQQQRRRQRRPRPTCGDGRRGAQAAAPNPAGGT